MQVVSSITITPPSRHRTGGHQRVEVHVTSISACVSTFAESTGETAFSFDHRARPA